MKKRCNIKAPDGKHSNVRYYKGVVALILEWCGKTLDITDRSGVIFHVSKKQYENLKRPSQQSNDLAAHSIVSVRDEVDKFDEIEKNFWNEYAGNEELHRIMEDVINKNVINNPEGVNQGKRKKQAAYEKHCNEAASLLVTRYCEYKIQNDPKFKLKKDDKDFLIEYVGKQLKSKLSYVPENSEMKSINGASLIITYRTKGDGSCGLHALLGMPNVDHIYECEDIAQKRIDFCDWLREKHAAGELPEGINIALTDYFDEFNGPHTPNWFKGNKDVIKQYQIHSKGYASLSNEEKDNRKQAFMDDKIVFECYLENLQKVGTYLLQEELKAAAIFFKKTIVICQPNWPLDLDDPRKGEIFNEEATKKAKDDNVSKETIRIWYNGTNHYERADEIIPQ